MNQETPELILYILSDEHRGMAMSHMGDVNLQTPNLDRMAAEGVSFRRAYANCPICVPSRGSIFSGRHAHAGPIQNFFDVYKASAPSTATLLREMGWHTAYFGKWHCGMVRDQLPPQYRGAFPSLAALPRPTRTPEYHRGGFQDWLAFEYNNAPFQSLAYRNGAQEPELLEGYQTDALTDETIRYLENYDRSEPLLFVLSVEPPHFPMEAPERFFRWDPATLAVPQNFADTPEMRRHLAAYYAMIENLDWNIGRLLDAVARHPRFGGKTLNVYFSDHGEYMGDRGAYERKEFPHEESVRIPAIFHQPGVIPARGVTEGLFSLVDLLPTTLGMAGAPIPSHAQGFDFSPLLRGEAVETPKAVALEMVGNPRWSMDFLDWRGIVTEEWKYVFYETGQVELYHLSEDPLETRNLAGLGYEQEACLKELLLAELKRTREPYFDVLMEHGAPPETPSLDIRWSEPGPLSPAWGKLATPVGDQKRKSI